MISNALKSKVVIEEQKNSREHVSPLLIFVWRKSCISFYLNLCYFYVNRVNAFVAVLKIECNDIIFTNSIY
ncbi:Uncharacterised protein [Chryseobacterium carnipullorum]|uniref:Uncharacterized protein n=1 Tax=Chryseobacterium carnipullorum TaxID=1124835 RepID=A0A376E0Z1_CHRCU|nr:Uncharacterised protein [Chryseobacterium carnipullorum]